MKNWNWKRNTVLVLLFLFLTGWGVYENVSRREAEKRCAVADTKNASSGGLVKQPEKKEEAKCACSPEAKAKLPPKKKFKKVGKKKVVVAVKKTTPLPPAVASPAKTPVPVATSAPTPPVTKPAPVVGESLFAGVDTNYWKKAKVARNVEQPVAQTTILVVEQPAKFYPVLPSAWNTCFRRYGNSYCDNGGPAYTQSTYVQPYAPVPHQPVAVPARPYIVTAPVIRTAPVVSGTNPPGMATR